MLSFLRQFFGQADIGQRAENRIAAQARRQGLRIVERNCQLGQDEIDIVAYDKGSAQVVFIEVRFRREGLWAAAASISATKRQAMIRAARRYLDLEQLAVADARIDLALATRDQNGMWNYDFIKNYLKFETRL